jgi:uncharacterized membrane-anchored protein
MDYAKIAPLLDEGSKLIYPMKRYIIAMALFLICSLSILDGIILRFSPGLTNFGYIILLIKALLFGVSLYMCDHIIQAE